MTKVTGFISFVCPDSEEAVFFELNVDHKPELIMGDGEIEIHLACPCCKRNHWINLNQMLGVAG